MMLDCPFSHLHALVLMAREDLRAALVALIDTLHRSEVLNLFPGARPNSFQVRLVRDRGDDTPDAVGNRKHLMRIFVRDDGGVTLAPYWGTYPAVKKRFLDNLGETDNPHLKQLRDGLQDIGPKRVAEQLELAAGDALNSEREKTPTVPTEHTSQLLARIENNDQDALNLLFGRLLPALRDTARSLLEKFRCRNLDVDELVAEFYTRTFQKLGATNFQNSEHIIRSAYQRMYWFVHDVLRRNGFLEQGTHQLNQLARTETGIQTRVERDDLIEIVWSAMETLPEDLRVAVQMRTAGMTYQEIADELDIGVATAHERFTKGINRLRAIIDE